MHELNIYLSLLSRAFQFIYLSYYNSWASNWRRQPQYRRQAVQIQQKTNLWIEFVPHRNHYKPAII
jgi:hypothetical protein